MTEISRLLRGPWWPLAIVALIATLGGPLNTVNARGVIVSDANGLPMQPRDVFFGQRHFAVGEDGVYNIPNLPRGAKISVIAQGYERVDASVDATEIRLVTSIITMNVAEDGTGNPIKNPEARVGDRVVGKGTESGIMVIAPAPKKEETILVCAAGYDPAFVNTGLPTMGIRLPKGEQRGCPALPGASPTPEPNQTPRPSGSPAASPAPSAGASPSPR